MKLTTKIIRNKYQNQDLKNINKVNFWGCKLDDVKVLSKLENIKVLSLSVNNIKSLSFCINLIYLEELYLRKNNIKELSEIHYLVELNKLTTLWLSDNPITQVPNYRQTIIQMLPHLLKLDGIPVTQEERNQCDLKESLNIIDIECKTEEKQDISHHNNSNDNTLKAVILLLQNLSKENLLNVSSEINNLLKHKLK